MFYYESHNLKPDKVVNIHEFNLCYHAHFHKNLELLFCAEGEIYATVSGKRYSLTKGEGIFIPENTIHSYETKGESELYAILFESEFIPELSTVFYRKSPINYTFPIDALLLNLVTEHFSGDKSIFSAKSVIYRAMQLFLKNKDFTEESTEEGAAIKMIDCIRRNFKNEISLNTFATENGYSYSYAGRLVKKYFGVSFSELVSEYRIDYARTLIRETKKSISEISEESGFGSIRSFNRTFLKLSGMTPYEYRIQIKKE